MAKKYGRARAICELAQTVYANGFSFRGKHVYGHRWNLMIIASFAAKLDMPKETAGHRWGVRSTNPYQRRSKSRNDMGRGRDLDPAKP